MEICRLLRLRLSGIAFIGATGARILRLDCQVIGLFFWAPATPPAWHRVFCSNLFPSVKGFPRHPLARAFYRRKASLEAKPSLPDLGRMRTRRTGAIRAGRMRYAPTSSYYQSHNHLLQAIGVGEDVIQAGDFILLLLLGIIKKHEVFLAAVEVEVADGFAVVFVEVTGKFLS
jgi:hypothetical protein